MAIELTNDTYDPYKKKMDRSIENLQGNLNAVRAGRKLVLIASLELLRC